jgi:D-alanyl-D-alanine carboxypeptidase
MVKRKRYKLKPDIFLYIAVLIVVIILANKGIDAYKEYKYHQTTEYKLIEVGYSKKDIKVLSKYLSEKELIKLTKEKQNKTLVNLMNSKYYLHKNLDQYLEYLDLNPDKTIDEVIKDVNIHHNYAYYENTIETNTSLNYELLVNKYYYLTKDYEPDDLVVISTKYSWGTAGSQKVRKEAYDAFIKMHEAANENGIYLMVNSSYRDYASQERVYNNYKTNHSEEYADKIAARPGFSEHQTGLALDIFSIKNPAQATFKDSDAYAWLKDNSYKYGFILRYPENLENITGYSFESWHYRYVGVETAKKVYESGLTYDEYYAYNIEK